MLRAISFGAVVLLFVAQTAAAGELKVISTRIFPLEEIAKGKCNAILTGEIAPGDADKVRHIKRNEPEPAGIDLSYGGETAGWSVCLASPGGNYLEALKLLRVFREDGWATVVPQNSTCLSACAIAFLGGTLASSNSNGGELEPYRVLHVTAQLGFHAPIFRNQAIPASGALEFFRSGVEAVTALKRLLPENALPGTGAILPDGLLLDILETFGSDNFYYIDTVDKAGVYNFHLAGVPAINLTALALARLCSNAVAWRHGEAHNPTDRWLNSWNYEICQLKSDPNDPTKDPVSEGCKPLDEKDTAIFDVVGGVGVDSRHDQCSVQGDANPGFDVTYNWVEETEAKRYLEPWHSLPYYVKLSDLRAKELDYSRLAEWDPQNVRVFLEYLKRSADQVVILQNGDEEMAINIAMGDQAEVLWADGTVDRTAYKLTGDTLCFGRFKGSSQGVCARVMMDSSLSAVILQFGKSGLATLQVERMRFGCIATLAREQLDVAGGLADDPWRKRSENENQFLCPLKSMN